MNRTLLSPNDANGTLDIDVFPDYIYKTNSRGLSAGAIVAIVLSCVAVIAAILAAIFFFSRGTNAPVKNIKEISNEMNLSESKVKSKLFRTRKKLKK